MSRAVLTLRCRAWLLLMASAGVAGLAAAADKAPEPGDFNERFDRTISTVSTAVSIYNAYGELNDGFSGLDASDNEANEAFNRESGPTVPSSCAQGSAACGACYSEAVRKIDFNRYWLLRARILTVNTNKVGKAGLAMLDAVSAAGQAAGPVLQASERPAIEKRLKTLHAKYEEKAAVYLSNLEAGMRALGDCEGRYFGSRDWYQRYGYLYVSFMQERYAKAPE